MAGPFDLVLGGGHVIDPSNGLDGPMDVAVREGRVAAVGAGLDAGAARCVDVSGLFVTPGLIDIHLHAFGGFDASCGVTTAVDTGSSPGEAARLSGTIAMVDFSPGLTRSFPDWRETLPAARRRE